jgi:ABC-type phosphate/phosphonate transport system substrate-binding protein
MGKIKEALSKSESADAKQQMAGWRVIKMSKPMPDGNIIYTHVITPVKDADYNILQVLYATFKDPAEQKELYDMYRGAFAANLGISSGTVAADLSK